MSLIAEKYSYQNLKRIEVEGKRRYSVPVGDPVPSVTTIIDSTKDKTHLIKWRKRVGEKKATEITTEAASVGTRMHKYIEDYVENGSWPEAGSNPYAKQAHRMAEQIKIHAFPNIDEIWGSEVNLYFPSIYAGTTDLVGTYKGQPCIMDFKQSNKPKKEEWVYDYFLQLTAYALAHNEIYGTNIREGHVFMCSRDLTYQQFDIWPEEFDDWEQAWWRRCEQYYQLRL